MADKDIALAILQGAIAIAGLVLIYVGFLAAKGDAAHGNRSGDVITIGPSDEAVVVIVPK